MLVSPAWGVELGEGAPQSIWLLRPVELEGGSSPGAGKQETLLLEGAHKVLCALGT